MVVWLRESKDWVTQTSTQSHVPLHGIGGPIDSLCWSNPLHVVMQSVMSCDHMGLGEQWIHCHRVCLPNPMWLHNSWSHDTVHVMTLVRMHVIHNTELCNSIAFKIHTYVKCKGMWSYLQQDHNLKAGCCPVISWDEVSILMYSESEAETFMSFIHVEKLGHFIIPLCSQSLSSPSLYSNEMCCNY